MSGHLTSVTELPLFVATALSHRTSATELPLTLLIPALTKHASRRGLHDLEMVGYSPTYLSVRSQFFNNFFYRGFIAGVRSLDVQTSTESVKFTDQTIYMGHALLALSLEARNLRDAGRPAEPQESLIREILRAFRRAERDADVEINSFDTPGFFYRDYVKRDNISVPSNWDVQSDFILALDSRESAEEHYAMSVDQVIHLFVGFQAVARWSQRDDNIELVRSFTTEILEYLISNDYVVRESPTGRTIIDDRGPEYWWACGWLSLIAEEITGTAYFHDPANIVAGRTVASAHGTITQYIHNPGLLALGRALEVILQAFGRPQFKIENYSSPHAMIRLALSSTAYTPDYSMWAWSNVGKCPWTPMLYTLLHDKPLPGNMPDVADYWLELMPPSGPSSEIARNHNWNRVWGKDSSLISTLNFSWSPDSQARLAGKVERYNGLDYMNLYSLRLATRGKPLTGRPCMTPDHNIYWTAPGVYTC